MSRKWPAPVDVAVREDPDMEALLNGTAGWQPMAGRPAQIRAQWLLWQTWRLGRWADLEHGFRQPGFDPRVRFVRCPDDHEVPLLNPVTSFAQPQHGWAFWLNVHPTPPNVWNAFQAAGDPWGLTVGAGERSRLEHALDVLWSRWWHHAKHALAFQEMLRRFEQGQASGWEIKDHPGLDEGLRQGWDRVDTARDEQGRFAPLCKRFAELTVRMQAWGVAWDAPMDDPDGMPRLWRLIQGQWMFLHPADVERDGWLGQLLVNDPNLWDGPQGIRSFWETAFEQDGPLFNRQEDIQGIAATWDTVQRVGDGARLRAVASIVGTGAERTRRRL